MDGPTSQVFARPDELRRWGVLAPPLARLQAALLGQVDDVLLTVSEVAAAAATYRGLHAGTAGRP